MIEKAELLTRIKRTVLGKNPAAKIYLYGSRVHGTQRTDSDWDIIILLNTEQVTADQEKNITDSLYDLEFDTGEVISPLVYAEKEWNTKYRVTPFYSNVMREALQL